MRDQLPYKVECKSSYPFFETIAAFNYDDVAFGYADSCAEVNPSFEYRVTKRGKVLQKVGSLK